MKAASLSELKKELSLLKPADVLACCMRLTKYKKENKELLTYLLFEINNEESFIESVKKDMDEQFSEINKSNTYFAKKTVRKILRLTNKQIKYSGLPQTEIELLIYFCKKLIAAKLKLNESAALYNLYQNQLKKINKSISKLHEDLQYDYMREIEDL